MQHVFVAFDKKISLTNSLFARSSARCTRVSLTMRDEHPVLAENTIHVSASNVSNPFSNNKVRDNSSRCAPDRQYFVTIDTALRNRTRWAGRRPRLRHNITWVTDASTGCLSRQSGMHLSGKSIRKPAISTKDRAARLRLLIPPTSTRSESPINVCIAP